MRKKTTLRVGVKTYTFHATKKEWNRLKHQFEEAHSSAGRTDNNSLEMHIDPSQAEGQMRDTIVHEILHALWADTGATSLSLQAEDGADEEEKFIRLMSPRLAAFLVDNKEFVAELIGLSPPPPQEA